MTAPQRFQFVKSKAMPGYYDLIDNQLHSLATTWPYEMSIMLGMMYMNLIKVKGADVADEFLYGALMGHTLTLIHADKLPRVEKNMSEDNNSVELKFIMPDGTSFVQKPDANGAAMQEFTSRMNSNSTKPE